MRSLFFLLLVIVAFASCKKDKYTTAPQIRFKDISPQEFSSDRTILFYDQAPKLILEVTDAEGDIGMIERKDTSRVYIKNLFSNVVDSFDLPNLQTSPTKNFKADIYLNLFNALRCNNSSIPRPRTDSLNFEVYVNDFAGNKSNVIVTGKPVLYTCL